MTCIDRLSFESGSGHRKLEPVSDWCWKCADFEAIERNEEQSAKTRWAKGRPGDGRLRIYPIHGV